MSSLSDVETSVEYESSIELENSRLEEKLKQFEELRRSLQEGSFSESIDDPLEIREDTDEVFDQSEQSRKKNLILDEDKFEDIFLKCLICRELFNDDDKQPKMLTCHHTFCLDCLRQMFRVEGEFRQNLTSAFRGMPIAVKIQCPTCRDGFIISEAEIIRLPNDHTILELLTFVKSTGKSDMQYCSKHQLQSLNFFCEPCGVPICCDCTILDHKEKDGHVVLNVEEALQKYTPVLNSTMQKLEDEREKLADTKVSLERAQENVDTIRRELGGQIRQTFDRLREALEERERELLDISERDIDRKRDKIQANLKLVNERVASLKKHSDVLQSATSEKDIRQMFGYQQTVQDNLSTPLEITDDTPNDFSVTFHFNSRQETQIKSQISNLGDVTFEHS